MPVGNEDDTNRRRRSPTIDDDDCGWHDRLVEHFGADGRGGEWARMMDAARRHEVEIAQLKELKWKLMGVITFGGILAGLLGWLIPLALSGRH